MLNLQKALKQFESIKKMIVGENNKFLVKRIVEELRFSAMGDLIVKFW